MAKSAETEKKEQYFGYNKVKWIIHLVYWTWKHVFVSPSTISLGKPGFNKRFSMDLWGLGSSFFMLEIHS